MESSLLDSSFFGHKRAILNSIPASNRFDNDNFLSEIEKITYNELLKNYPLLELELNSVKNLLERKTLSLDEAQVKNLWLYCLGLNKALSKFYRQYSHTAKEAEMNAVLQSIKEQLGQSTSSLKKELNIFEKAVEEIENVAKEIKDSLTQTSKLRSWLDYSNVRRLYWVFCRLTLVNGFLLAKNLNLMDRLDIILGTHTDVEKITRVMQSPNGILNYLSVGLFLGRLVIDTSHLIRHTFLPNKDEGSYWEDMFARFKHEFWKRHTNFANDIAWSSVNLLTNFRFIIGPTADFLLVGFLGFDVLMQIYKLSRAYDDYKYHQEMYASQLKSSFGAEKIFYEKQLQELETNWHVQRIKFCYLSAAAALLMVGFASTVLFSPPGIVVAGYFLCMFAAAMYLSAENFIDYQDKRLHSNAIASDFAASPELKLEKAIAKQKAQQEFAFGLARNVLVPSMFIATMAIYWPAALTLLVAYGSYKLLSYNATSNQKKPSPEDVLSTGLVYS